MTQPRSVYIAGPMRGYPRYNFGAFESATLDLQALGIEVTSPHQMDLDIGFDPEKPLGDFSINDCVRRDVDAIIKTEAVVFLQGWQKSKGARAEKIVAEWLDRPCLEYPSLEPLVESETILQEAQRLVHGDRANSYGPPMRDFDRTAKIWEAILGIKITPEQVALCMIGVKISRECNNPKRDNVVDIAGYAETLDMVKQSK